MITRKRQKENIKREMYCKPKHLFLWENNPRKNDHSVQKLAKLLVVYGQRSPVIVWNDNNTVYKGNTTVKAIKFLQNLTKSEFEKFTLFCKKLPCIPKIINRVWVNYQNFKDEQEAINYAISDNKSSEWSEWQQDILDDLIDANSDNKEKFISVWGFTKSELQSLEIPNIQKINKKKSKQQLKGFIVLRCKESQKEDLLDWLREELPENGFNKIEIK